MRAHLTVKELDFVDAQAKLCVPIDQKNYSKKKKEYVKGNFEDEQLNSPFTLLCYRYKDGNIDDLFSNSVLAKAFIALKDVLAIMLEEEEDELQPAILEALVHLASEGCA
jgi:hypothetical protein